MSLKYSYLVNPFCLEAFKTNKKLSQMHPKKYTTNIMWVISKYNNFNLNLKVKLKLKLLKLHANVNLNKLN